MRLCGEVRPRGSAPASLSPAALAIALPAVLAIVLLAGLSRPTLAHDAPYSFLDLRLSERRLEGTLTAHIYDLAHEIGLASPEALLDPAQAQRAADTLAAVLAPRLALIADGRRLAPHWTGVEIAPEKKGLTFRFEARWAHAPGQLDVEAHLFPYDPQHETYLNVYESGALRLQELLDRSHDRARHYTGGRQGILAVLGTFIGAGIHHIFIGPDHILFVIGLLLLGGGVQRLLKIVTAFTAAHSVTLALATLGLVSPPARLVEPLIALSIVFVGVANLRSRAGGADPRMGLAFAFGLVHGFGFASVLRDFGLPQQALGWSLLAFNLGVETGQACIVGAVAPLLVGLHGRSPAAALHAVRAGSWVVALAGAYWLGERLWIAIR